MVNTLWGPVTYGFSNAKVAALKAKLISPSAYKDMVSMSSVSAVAELLESTPYKPYLAKVLKEEPLSSKAIERAALLRFSRILQLLERYVPAKDKPIYSAFTLRYDVYSAKLVFGSLLRQQSIPPLMEANLSADDWREIYTSKQPVEAFIRQLFPLEEAQLLLKELPTRSPSIDNYTTLVQWLDTLILRKAQALRGLKAYAYIVKYADIQNIISLIKARKEHSQAPAFVEGGSIPPEKLKMAIHSDVTYKEFLSRYKIDDSKALPLIQRDVELYLSRKKKELYNKSLFTLDRVFFYLLLLEEELLNIRRVVVSKALNVPAEKVMEVLVI